ncbi:MAG: HAD family hydrolase [Candidatus Marinimicrobia bacterium]|nr:HAD family hydrolase [Candidatus Neomarinimicrobiota bacterium]
MTGRSGQADARGSAPAWFVGVDSDGCVFDTMEMKQRRVFHPLIIAHWQLEPIAAAVRETACFVNLYSCWRGSNRFAALLKTFELLAARADVRASGVALPATAALATYVASAETLGEPSLDAASERTGEPELARVLAWSRAVNEAVAALEPGPPFAGVPSALAALAAVAETVVISQTPAEALEREWTAHDLRRYVQAIAGQEVGSKTAQLQRYAADYAPDRRLMIGDALGDARAAAEVGAQFYPILPGREAASWTRFQEEAWPRFQAGRYAGAYAAGLQREFAALLPEKPPWSQA